MFISNICSCWWTTCSSPIYAGAVLPAGCHQPVLGIPALPGRFLSAPLLILLCVLFDIICDLYFLPTRQETRPVSLCRAPPPSSPPSSPPWSTGRSLGRSSNSWLLSLESTSKSGQMKESLILLGAGKAFRLNLARKGRKNLRLFPSSGSRVRKTTRTRKYRGN